MLLHRRLDELLDLMGPSKRVVIAMDGPAPLAKLLEQRRRRRREADRDDNSAQALAALDPEISPVEPAEGGPDARSSRRKIPEFATAVSPLFLTTGTVFMLEVHNSLACYICHRLADPRYEHLHFELSDSTVKGEGELKILSRLITAVAEGREGESHAVIGGDSDLVVMSMISGRSKLVVCDDRPPKERARGGKGHRSPHVLFCRDALQAAWEKEGHLPQGASKEEFSALSLDLALLSIICNGNGESILRRNDAICLSSTMFCGLVTSCNCSAKHRHRSF